MPKATEKTSMEPEEKVEIMDIEEVGVEEASLHGEAKKHICLLDQAIKNMEVKINEGELKDVINGALECFKKVIKNVVLTIAEADVTAVLHTIKDPMCMALRPQTEETEQI